MINYIYQLVSPGLIAAKYEDISSQNDVIIKPTYMSICRADQRYYFGLRDPKKLSEKLPMALIHECVGKVLHDPTGTYKSGQKVVMIPNVPSPSHNPELYENYEKGSGFLSSGKDGFMREFVNLPVDRVVPYFSAKDQCAAITEFVSVAVHAVTRLLKVAHGVPKSIGIWGDGGLAYVLSNVIKTLMPEVYLTVIGKDSYKISQFMFVDEVFLSDDIPENFSIDCAFECAGGEGSYYAINDIIKYINPQGSAMLMGVSENKIAINTRDILEKGITLVGCSRSGREDFEKAVECMERIEFQNRIARIIYEDESVNNIDDIYRAFETDKNTPFKTVFKWNL